eukprot:CAMPEP_0182608538 /NCGR_PEP_ID=MMETSP1330-20130603/2929_1 /TAXON_ID=464278 /ORGANISM="Picochlorum sp., Strain RCC944" /LENGTH=306 /DNA_ID=CAMNT_0024827299 /DNA_START=365 /DNA_END=1283 /DNA_ORIENTATION=+
MPYHVSAMQTGLSRSFRGKVEEKAFERCFENGGDINQRHHADRERKKSDNNCFNSATQATQSSPAKNYRKDDEMDLMLCAWPRLVLLSQATFANAQQETRGVAIEGIGEIQRLGNEVERVASTGDRNAAFVGSGVTYGLKYARRLLDDDDEVDDSADSSWSEVGDSFAEVGNDIAGAFDQLGNELGDELKDVFSGRRSYARRLLDDDDRSDGDEVDDSADSSWSEVGDSFAQVGSDIKGAFNQLGDQLKDAFSGRRLLDADSVGYDEVEFDIAGGFNGAFDEFAELQNAIAGGRKLLDGESPIVGD